MRKLSPYLIAEDYTQRTETLGDGVGVFSSPRARKRLLVAAECVCDNSGTTTA